MTGGTDGPTRPLPDVRVVPVPRSRTPHPAQRPVPDQHAASDQVFRALVGWLRTQHEGDGDADIEAIALVMTSAISHYQSMTDVLDAPFGIEEDRYFSAIADLATASLNH